MRKLSLSIILLITLIFCSTEIKNTKTIPLKEDFLSLVRYIILDEEKDMYKEYPPAEREEFIEQFWARRDPRPSTIKNEFKEKFLQKIEEANKLSKGKKGWL